MSQTVKEVAITIKRKMNNLPRVSTECCIYRVPDKLRRAIISIGPFHHDKKELQLTEEIKLRYLTGFLHRSKADLPACTRMISELEDRIRQCYQEKLTQGSYELVEMILVDAVFLVELFIRNYNWNHGPDGRDLKDEIFSKQWMSDAVFHDLLLLENQVPLFVLENLYNLTALSTTITFFKLSYEYFKDVQHGHELASTGVHVNHLVDYVRALQLPMFLRRAPSKQGKKTGRVKELQEAGITFKRGKETSVLDVIFKDGTLKMPHVVVHEWTEVYLRNMIAYEQCHHEHKYISSYAILMDSLIGTPDDVDILISAGILEHQLCSADGVARIASIINGIHKETLRDSSEFYYSSLCESLNAYSRSRWHQCKAAWYRWRVILNRDYFSNPWSGISVVAAMVLLILASVQTAYSILQFYAGDGQRLFPARK
ncbi:hypothetical protein ACJRO7_014501 [Eucalyptus globulus]|uniref:Uncharacterized protein n=1 Tax=Eucalyptus globulus TaxID=34317 RepID=A0ABD3L4B2_EUCGL